MNHELKISLHALLLNINTSNNKSALNELNQIYGNLNHGKYRTYKLSTHLEKVLITLFAHLQLVDLRVKQNNSNQAKRYKKIIQNKDALNIKRILKTNQKLVTKIK